MKLQTNIPFKKEAKNLINYQSKILLLGSCFSENIGQKLTYFKFQVCQNPFGILFHPKAIEKLIANAIGKKVYTEKDIIFKNERYHSFDAHSSVSTIDKNKLLETLNHQSKKTDTELKNASQIIITLGTAWVYQLKENNTIVANCHKVPQQNFIKKLLSVDEIIESLQKMLVLIKYVNKNANIIFTVSPVRHLKDGFIENMQSKAHLIAAIHAVVQKENQINYFPSYELMMDELRDYRFYAEDMIHPNKTAIQYIWEKFTETWFSAENANVMKQIDVIQKGISHKPFHEKSKEHQEFLANLSIKKNKIQAQFPFITF